MRVVDLFSGIGGMSLGFIRAGFDLVCAMDFWEEALKVYAKNFDHDLRMVDLSQVEPAISLIQGYSPDLIIGGPPCQDFSSAGKRDEEGGRADLTLAYARIVSSIRPRIFVMENVERITKSKKLQEAKAILQEAGYKFTEMVLDASLCSVPQKRKRFILIGDRELEPDAYRAVLQEGLSTHPMTVREHCGDLIGVDYYYRHPRSYVRRGVFSIDEPSPTIRGVNRPIPQGYRSHQGDRCLDLSRVRSLTTRERSYIQTFPASFILEGSKTALEQMIGNAVPINLAYYIASAILQRNGLEVADKPFKPRATSPMPLFTEL